MVDWNIKGSISKVFVLFYASFSLSFSKAIRCSSYSWLAKRWKLNSLATIKSIYSLIRKTSRKYLKKSVPRKTQIVSKLNEIEYPIHTEIDLKRRIWKVVDFVSRLIDSWIGLIENFLRHFCLLLKINFNRNMLSWSPLVYTVLKSINEIPSKMIALPWIIYVFVCSTCLNWRLYQIHIKI